MAASKPAVIAFTVVVLFTTSAMACRFAGRTDLPNPHGAALKDVGASRRLFQTNKKNSNSAPVSDAYVQAVLKLKGLLAAAIANCSMSSGQMRYVGTPTNTEVTSDGSFFPAGSWLRAFFHDAGTFVKADNSGGLNGSLGKGCPNNTCLNLKTPFVSTRTCPDGTDPLTGFTDGKSYCCPAGQCITDAGVNSSVVPACLTGTADTNEICRRENLGLSTTFQFYRARQAQILKENNITISLADIMALGAATAVQVCSLGEVVPEVWVGRIDATEADVKLLPSPQDVLNALDKRNKHDAFFSQMGLSQKEMVTSVVGSHTLGGYRFANSPGLTNCTFNPFDCTPAGQFAAKPFDNSVFQVACASVGGPPPTCSFTTMCPVGSLGGGTCPFEAGAFGGACGGAPSPGLVSDVALCTGGGITKAANVRKQMLRYASNEAAFYADYKDVLATMANLGYNTKVMTHVQ